MTGETPSQPADADPQVIAGYLAGLTTGLPCAESGMGSGQGQPAIPSTEQVVGFREMLVRAGAEGAKDADLGNLAAIIGLVHGANARLTGDHTPLDE